MFPLSANAKSALGIVILLVLAACPSTDRETAREREGPVRRVVTADSAGKSIVQSDEELPAYQFKSVPGYEHTLVWVTEATPDLGREQKLIGYPARVVP